MGYKKRSFSFEGTREVFGGVCQRICPSVVRYSRKGCGDRERSSIRTPAIRFSTRLDKNDGKGETKMSQPVTVELPYFVVVVLSILPRFLEAVDLDIEFIRRVEFNPDCEGEREDPAEGQVTFYGFFDHQKVTFTVKYRSGEEGTRGAIDRIHRIDYFSDQDCYSFHYLQHYCACNHCEGMKYPFLPLSFNRANFERMSEGERFQTIREYLSARVQTQ